jgi:hypothetical protein
VVVAGPPYDEVEFDVSVGEADEDVGPDEEGVVAIGSSEDWDEEVAEVVDSEE